MSVSAIPAQVKVNFYFFTQTGKYEVSHVSDAVFPQHVSLLRGVGNVRNDAGLILPGGSTLEKYLNNNDRNCVWYKVGARWYVYVYILLFVGSKTKSIDRRSHRMQGNANIYQSCFLERYIAMILTALCHSKFLGKSYTPSTALVSGVFLSAIGYKRSSRLYHMYVHEIIQSSLLEIFASLLYILLKRNHIFWQYHSQ